MAWQVKIVCERAFVEQHDFLSVRSENLKLD